MPSSSARPLLVVGDAPNLSNGLGRIARDLAALLHEHGEELGVRVGQLGWGWDGQPFPWPVYPLFDQQNWGKGDILQTLSWHAGQQDALVFTVWDPARCYPIAEALKGARAQQICELWGYFPLDSHNAKGAVGGVAREALAVYDHRLAYLRFGARVIDATVRGDRDTRWVPHGIGETWQSGVRALQHPMHAGFLRQVGEHDLLVGVVAANQPRKDYGLVFQAVERMREVYDSPRGKVKLWIHTDRPVRDDNDLAWAMPELAEVHGALNKETCVTTNLSDHQLAEFYGRSGVTLAPGAGEGFCYPIAESQACGTPVVHGGFGAGREIVADQRWVIEPVATRLEGPYALVRPVYDPEDWAQRALEAARWKREDPRACRAYCAGAVDYLRWGNLEHRWLEVFREWLKGGGRA